MFGAASFPRSVFLRGRQHFREALRQTRYLYRLRCRETGVLPDFLLVGAMKAGTTSLYDYVRQHPGVLPPTVKEIQYFNKPSHLRQGERWYRAQFPTRARMDQTSERLGYSAVTGEATPQMHLPLYASLAAELVPDARIVMILRDPVSRAYSHYRHWCRHSLRFPKESFWDALQREEGRVTPELERLARDPGLRPEQAIRYSYRTRGYYADQIEQWRKHFPQERILILNFDDLRANAASVCKRFFDFVGLPPWPVQTTRVRNAGRYDQPIDDRSRHYLTEHFRPYNRRLFDLIGEDWGWPS